MGCLGFETNAVIEFNFVHKLGSYIEVLEDIKTDVLLGFLDWPVKPLVLN